MSLSFMTVLYVIYNIYYFPNLTFTFQSHCRGQDVHFITLHTVAVVKGNEWNKTEKIQNILYFSDSTFSANQNETDES